MQHAKKILFMLLPAALALSSCGRGLQQIRVEDVRNVSVQPAGGGKMLVTLDAKVSNPSCYAVQLTKLELNVALRESVLAIISTADKVAIPRHNDDFQPLLLEVRLPNLLTTLVALQRKQLSPNEMTVEGELKVQSFLLSKTIKIEKQQLDAFAAQYGDFITPLLNMQSK